MASELIGIDLKDIDDKHLIERIRIIKAEQHRNTRHDAVDKINEIRDNWSKTHDFSITDKMFDEIIGSIMNLKQRT